MTAVLQPFLPYLVVALLVGLVATFGPAMWARRPAAKARLLALSGRTLAVGSLLAVVVGVGAAWMLVRPFLRPDGAAVPSLTSFGLLMAMIGLPLALPGFVFAWKESRRREATRAARRASTKDDRRAYAQDLLEQIRDASPGPRTLEASVAGDGGSILRFEGDLKSKEGERLTRALREDLEDMGFKRVEGDAGPKGWWTRV